MDTKDLNLYAVLDSLADGVTLADMDGRIFFQNKVATDLLGMAMAETLPDTWAKHYGVFLPDGVTPFPTERYAMVRALDGQEVNGNEMIIKNARNPRGRLLSVSGRPLRNEDGSQVGAAVVIRDITKQRAMERMREELTALIVHDLKSPLTGIMCAADLLLMSQNYDDMDREAAIGIRDASQRLQRMVLDLLDIHLAEDGAFKVEKSPLRVAPLLEEVQAFMKARVLSAGQEIRLTHVPEDLVAHVDGAAMRRVLQNLVDNCVKYAGRGGTIWMDAAKAANDGVLLRVRDDGPGVPAEMRTRIFDKYASAERDEHLDRGGSRGLGLRFCYVAVEAHGGRVWVEDNDPMGACFCVEVPTSGGSVDGVSAGTAS